MTLEVKEGNLTNSNEQQINGKHDIPILMEKNICI